MEVTCIHAWKYNTHWIQVLKARSGVPQRNTNHRLVVYAELTHKRN